MKQNQKIDLANKEEIRLYLSDKAQGVKIEVAEEVGSTNDEMKKAALNGEKEISVLIAHKQSAGKGRKGRSFYSPENTGIYMSFLLRPKYSPEECTLLTTMAAAAASESIEKVTGKKTQIKWVNDVFMEGRKVAGILTESAFAPNGSVPSFAIVGIGINISPPSDGFPEEISDIAGTVLSDSTVPVKNRLVAEIINNLVENYYNLTQREYLEHYRKRLFFFGQEITVIETSGTYKATAIDIDEMCHLIVRLSDGTEKVLYGGEISIKP